MSLKSEGSLQWALNLHITSLEKWPQEHWRSQRSGEHTTTHSTGSTTQGPQECHGLAALRTPNTILLTSSCHNDPGPLAGSQPMHLITWALHEPLPRISVGILIPAPEELTV